MSDPLTGLPLASIRVFEAAARLRSFTRAAEELGMTQAAVSWQIKALENRLGLSLFRRLPREVVPTEPGERLSRAATEAMVILRRAFSDVTEADEAVLSITTVTTLATQWLAPRLGAFQVANPGLAVRVDTGSRLVDLGRENIDIALRVGSGIWPGAETALLMPSVFAPLCTPLLRDRLGLREPADLMTAPRIGDEKEWAAWFIAAGVASGASRTTGFRADIQGLEIAAALGHQGVALGSPILYTREIEAGLLVQPFDTVIELSPGYWIAWPTDRRLSPKIARFRAWLLEEAARDPTIRAGFAALGRHSDGKITKVSSAH